MTGNADWEVRVEGFEGPLDLLLRLIERRELDVTALSLALVADQYLAHLDAVRRRAPETLTTFLVILAKLLLIKSIALLPGGQRRSDPDETVEDPTGLAERILAYRRARAAGAWLLARAEPSCQQYRRPPIPYVAPTAPATRESPELLRLAMYRLFERQRRRAESVPVASIAVDEFTVADGISLLESALQSGAAGRFSQLHPPDAQPRRLVATFLALLELVRLQRVAARQDDLFDEIELSAGSVNPNAVDDRSGPSGGFREGVA